MKNKKKLIYLGSALLLAIILLVVGKKAGWFGERYLLEVSVEAPILRTITETVTANGKVQPQMEVKLSADVSGEIVELTVLEGQKVTKGQLLAKIKPDIYQSSLERAEAALNGARSNYSNAKARLTQVEAQYNQAKRSFDRSKKLWEQKTISDSEYEQALSGFEVAEAELEASKQNVKSAEYQVNSAVATVNEAKENLQKTVIYAPMSGTISKLNVELGERVVGTMQMAGTEVMRIADLNQMEVTVQVNENDIVRVDLGDTALIEIDAYLGQKFKGLVSEIANSATSSGLSATDQVTNFEVKIRILPESYKHLNTNNLPEFYPFRPGMSATVEIQTNTRVRVLTVPIQAVTVRNDSTGTSSVTDISTMNEEDSGEPKKEDANKTDVTEVDEAKEVVFVAEGDMAKMYFVKTGIQDNLYIEILSGLPDSVSVIVAPYTAISKKLKVDTKIKVVDKEKLFSQNKDKE